MAIISTALLFVVSVVFYLSDNLYSSVLLIFWMMLKANLVYSKLLSLHFNKSIIKVVVDPIAGDGYVLIGDICEVLGSLVGIL